MNQFKMSLFLPPISPVKDSATGRTVQPPTLTPYKEITLQEVYKLITSSERLKTLTEVVKRLGQLNLHRRELEHKLHVANGFFTSLEEKK